MRDGHQYQEMICKLAGFAFTGSDLVDAGRIIWGGLKAGWGAARLLGRGAGFVGKGALRGVERYGDRLVRRPASTLLGTAGVGIGGYTGYKTWDRKNNNVNPDMPYRY